jgi:hypothetical protein
LSKRDLAGLEEIPRQARGEWNLTLLRTLWRYLEASSPQRRLSVEHEEGRIINASFLLRPALPPRWVKAVSKRCGVEWPEG